MPEYADSRGPQPSIRGQMTARMLASGFDVVGYTTPDGIDPGATARFTEAASSESYSAMRWLGRTAAERLDPRTRYPWVRSVVMVAAAYGDLATGDQLDGTRCGPRPFARYAVLPDYHEWVSTRLKDAGEWLTATCPGARIEVMVDSGPVAEKLFAAAAGIGWIGRNTLLISPDYGSWMVLGTLLTNVELEPTDPAPGECGNCRACVDACPTGAIHPDGGLDPRRCLPYLTVESKRRGNLLAQAQRTGHCGADRAPLFGCDICQEVCPQNVGVAAGSFGAAPRIELPTRDEYLSCDDGAFLERFAGTPIARGVNRGWRARA